MPNTRDGEYIRTAEEDYEEERRQREDSSSSSDSKPDPRLRNYSNYDEQTLRGFTPERRGRNLP